MPTEVISEKNFPLTCSVIIPVCRGGTKFGECLSSAMAAIQEGDEIIVVADGEGDGSWRVAEQMSVRVVNLEATSGPGRARNAGAEASKSDILFFIDADVTIPSDSVERVRSIFEKEKDLAALIGSYDEEPAEANFHSLRGNAASDGSSPYGGPIQASDGSFYGTTEGGGLRFVGVAYRIAAPEVQLAGVVSRKQHGTAGIFDVDLTNGGIECRSGGDNGDYTLVFTFANPLTNVDLAAVSSGAGSVVSSAIGSDAHQYIVTLTGVTNAQQLGVALSNVHDAAGNVSNSISATMNTLVGDTTADRFVNSGDIGQTKSQSGIAVTSSNFREDVTADGFINSGDIGLVKSKSGTALP